MALREFEFENRLEVFGGHARACASFAYTELTFGHELRTNRELAKQMDAHRTFWRHLRAALRTALFAALGRIYDENRNSNSAGQFLRFCERHLELFSRVSYIARQTAAGVPRDLAAQRAWAAFEPQPGAFAPMFGQLDCLRRFYHRVVQPTKARLLRAGEDGRDADGPTRDDELSGAAFAELAVFPLRMHRALEGLYREGRAPILAEAPLELEAILTGHAAGAWEHVRAARSAAAFMRSQRFAAPLLDALSGDAADYLPAPAALARAEAGPA
jgi:hypothetical protein